MAKGTIFGRMEVNIKVVLKMVNNMAKVNSSVQQDQLPMVFGNKADKPKL